MDADRPLVAAAATGDRDAFGVLVRRYQMRLVNLALALGVSPADAEDVTQDAFVRAWKGVAGFRGASSFKTWLYRVAVNVIQSHLTARARRSGWWTSRVEAEDDAVADHVDPRLGVDEAIGRRQAIDRALASLPADLRVAVTLRDLQGLDYAEIAEALQVPIGTVESRIFRARQKLRPLLAALVGGSQARSKN